MPLDPQHIAAFQAWQRDSNKFVEDTIPDLKLTNQQRDGFKQLSALINAKIKRGRGEKLTEKEKEYADKIGISIMSGKGCHARGTEILMYDGSIRLVENIEIGDVLMGDDSSPRIVTSLSRGREQMWRLRYADGTYHDVNQSHILSLRMNGTHGAWKKNEIRDITVQEFIAWPKSRKRRFNAYRVPVEFNGIAKKHLRIPPYILGLWLGDGCHSSSLFTNVDDEIAQELKSYAVGMNLNYRFDGVKQHRLSGKIRGRPNGNSHLNALRSYGLMYNKHIPVDYMFASKQNRLEVLAGLIDSDGTLDSRNKRIITICQKRESLARQIFRLARSVGIHATIHPIRRKWQNGVGDYWQVALSCNVEQIPVRIPRKKPRLAYRRPFSLNFTFQCEPLGEQDFYGFSITGNGRFVLGDFTVTHNTGKDTFAAVFIIWFLCCFPFSQIPCTAPTGHQLKDVLWKEINKWLRQSKVKDWITWQSDKVFFNESEGKEWFAAARTCNPRASAEEQAETLGGFHEKYLAVVFDESSRIPDPVYGALEGTLTDICNFIINIFNPTRSRGFAVETHTKDRGQWIALRWDAEESDLVTKESIAGLARKYGRDSNFFRIYVKGLPPISGEKLLIEYDWAEDAIERDIEAIPTDSLVFGIDVGGGGDSSVLIRRRGPVVEGIEARDTPEAEQLINWIAKEIYTHEPDMVLIDTIGIGWAVEGGVRARCRSTTIIGINISEASTDELRFYRLRDELCWSLREKFEKQVIKIPDDPLLIGEMTSLKYDDERTDGKLKVESKKDLKKRGIESPNRFDALMLTEYYDYEMLRRMAGRQKEHFRREEPVNWKSV